MCTTNDKISDFFKKPAIDWKKVCATHVNRHNYYREYILNSYKTMRKRQSKENKDKRYVKIDWKCQ